MELWHFEFLEGGFKIQKSTEIFFRFFRPSSLEKSPFWVFYLGFRKQAVILKYSRYETDHGNLMKKNAPVGIAHFLANSGQMHFGSRNWSWFLVLEHEMTP